MGVYYYGHTNIVYTGIFAKNRMHGKGKLLDLDTKKQIDVVYDNGKCLTELPPDLKEKLRKDKAKQGEIPEDIEG